MRRVQAAASRVGGITFNPTWTNFTDMMARNKTWLQGHIDKGARILDIGRDAARATPSAFYQAEVKLLELNGYTPQFVRYAIVDGELVKVREWVLGGPKI